MFVTCLHFSASRGVAKTGSGKTLAFLLPGFVKLRHCAVAGWVGVCRCGFTYDFEYWSVLTPSIESCRVEPTVRDVNAGTAGCNNLQKFYLDPSWSVDSFRMIVSLSSFWQRYLNCIFNYLIFDMYLTIWLFILYFFISNLIWWIVWEWHIFCVRVEPTGSWNVLERWTRNEGPDTQKILKRSGNERTKVIGNMWQTWPPDKLPNIGEHDIDIQNNSPESWVGMAYNGCWSMLITKILRYERHDTPQQNQTKQISLYFMLEPVFFWMQMLPPFFGGLFFCYTSNKNNNSIYVYMICVYHKDRIR